jgi:hypothetical protein
VLGALEFVQDDNRIGDIFHAHLVDVDGPGAGVVLDVGEGHRREYGRGFGRFHIFVLKEHPLFSRGAGGITVGPIIHLNPPLRTGDLMRI